MTQTTTSLTSLTIKYMAVIFGFVFLVSSLSFYLLKNYMQEQYLSEQMNNVRVKAHEISEVIRFYSDIATQLTRQPLVRDLAQFGNREGAVKWSKTMRNLLPQNIGLAILDSNGNILGALPDLLVGEFCMRDLKLFYDNVPIIRPAIHTENKKLAHFDIIQSIKDDDETIGVLFASFSLAVVQKKLDNIIEHGQKLTVVSKDGQRVASAGRFDQNELIVKRKIAIPGSDWFLLAEIKQPDLSHLWMVLFLANLMLFVVVSACMYFFARKINIVFKRDFSLVTDLLNSLNNKHKLPEKIKPTQFAETQNLVSSVMSIASEIAYYHNQLLAKSNTDELTGLPNRRYFRVYAKQQIAQAERNNDTLVFLYIDLDGFKEINDTHGHAAGDQILQVMAERFRRFLRKNELMARLGGDEFCLLIYGTHEPDVISNTISRLKQECTQDIFVQGKIITPDLSVGTAVYPEDGHSYDELIARADQSMYQDKKRKKNTQRTEDGGVA